VISFNQGFYNGLIYTACRDWR